MAPKDNQVYKAAMQFCRDFDQAIPEGVFYGYSKFLPLKEEQIRLFIPDEAMADLGRARKWFSDNNLDSDLIRSGLSLLTSLLPTYETNKKYAEFKDFIESVDAKTGSDDILDKARECATIDITTVFKKGNDLHNVFKCKTDLEKEKQESSLKNIVMPTIKAPANKTSDQTKKAEIESTESVKEQESAKKRDLVTLSGRYRDLAAALLDRVKGQDQAILKFIQGYNQGELLKQSEKKNSPRTCFFFFGPPGVGKTLLAKTAAENLGIPYKIYNMSEYAHPQAYEDMIGISNMFNKAKEGTLLKFVRENPECLLIFDEIEKAHINAIRQFLQILGSGSMHNVFRDEETDFRKTTIVFTSNVGKELYEDRSVNLTTLPEKVIIDAIQSEKNIFDEPVLPPELCSRIASGNTIMFNHLSIQYLVEMVKANFDEIVTGMENEYGVQITYAVELPLLFLYNRGGEIDARVAVGQSGLFLKNEIYEFIRQLENRKTKARINTIRIDIDWKGMDDELKKLFKNNEKSEVLVFSDNRELFDDINDENFVFHRISTIEEGNENLKKDIAAVYIDPFFGTGREDETVLSISDYNTDGIRFFRSLVEKKAGLPIYMLEMDRNFSEVDKNTFLQEGAFGTVSVVSGQKSGFIRQFCGTMEELYMEKESRTFSQRGYVIDFNTRQEIGNVGGKGKIMFYGLKKRLAVDVKSRGAILSDAERPNVSFSDVIGAEKAKEELKYFVNYLKDTKQFLTNGGRPPKGVLLYGPPGTGKTMLAKAMAGESDVTFLQTSAADFKNKYLGESEKNVHRLFAKAKRYAPSIIFIDEIDAIGKKRTGSEFTASTESILNVLLTEMDGFSSTDPSKPVFVLAATNFGAGAEQDGISSLDDALIRRFDNKIYVDLPNESERKEYIMRMKAKTGMDQITEGTAQSIAERTTGQSLAVLQNVIELAQRNASKENRPVNDGDLLTALEEYVYGEKKDHTPDYYREVAIHETGHAYISYISGDKPSYITIESRGNFGGYMQPANQEEVTGYTKEELLAKIRTALAGRAAEEVFLGKEKSLNTGASSDLQKATAYAWKIVCTYGMDGDNLVVLNRDEVLRSPMSSDYVTKINGILKEQMDQTLTIIKEAKDRIRAIADVLIKENRLTGAQFEELMEAGNHHIDSSESGGRTERVYD